MTTIVVDRLNLKMAADRQIVDDGGKYTGPPKIQYIGNDWLLGTAGDVAQCQHFEYWLKRNLDKADTFEKPVFKSKNKSFSALLLKRDKTLWLFDNGTPILVNDRFFAIGSGGNYALGALMVCEDVREAVRIACLLDSSSGLGIQYEAFGPRESV